MLLPLLALGCRCGSPEPGTEPPTAEPSGTVDDKETDANAPPEGTQVSAEVQALIDAGDTQAIAADLEIRATRCRTLAAATGNGAQQMETVAESMTGRNETVNPRDPQAVTQLLESAEQIASGATELSSQVTELQQLVVDMRAEADALYGRPSP